MPITDKDLAKIGKVVRENINEALEAVVFPKFEEIDKRIGDEVGGVEKKMTKKIGDVEKRLSDKIDGVELRLGRRIDSLAAVATEVKTNHERRIVRLEEKAGFAAT